MREQVYVCIEGLDGSGKSTLHSRILDKLNACRYRYSTLNPTRISNPNHILEVLYRKIKVLERNWIFRSFLYANRSRQATARVDRTTPLLLGDRSLITSYVVYWHRFKSPRRAISWVEFMERDIPAPGHVLFLDLDREGLEKRKRGRGLPLTIDEKGNRPDQMREAYQFLMRSSIPRLEKTKWHVIDATQEPEKVFLDAWGIMESVVPGLR